MLCSVYKSPKRNETYLYVEKQGDFSRVPDALLTTFGKPEHVLTLELHENRNLAGADIQKVLLDLIEQGFYLQLPQLEENALEIHKAMQKAEAQLSRENDMNQLPGES